MEKFNYKGGISWTLEISQCEFKVVLNASRPPYTTGPGLVDFEKYDPFNKGLEVNTGPR